MASSSKVMFKLNVLQEKALESIDERIAIRQGELEDVGSEERLQEMITEWRAKQEKKISDVFGKLGGDELDNYTLSRFKLDPFPEVDGYDRNRIQRALNTLLASRSQIVAKSGSLVADAEGNIALTKTQLEEFFGL